MLPGRVSVPGLLSALSAGLKDLSRSWVAVALLVTLGWAAAAHAEDAVTPPPPGTRPLADTPFRGRALEQM